MTDANGTYALYLTAGTYDLTASAPGDINTTVASQTLVYRRHQDRQYCNFTARQHHRCGEGFGRDSRPSGPHRYREYDFQRRDNRRL